ncbi:hypothetical protein BDW_12220 [Bdellovibrio bacteriovorus W]|nr:hypothetical protein BDW_12220 [Bdellovibrio bacteriovorus W]
MEFNKEMLSQKSTEIMSALKNQFPNLNLSEQEVRTALKNPDELIELVCSRTGMQREQVEEKFHKVLSSVGVDSEKAKGFMAKMGSKVENKFDQIKDKFNH